MDTLGGFLNLIVRELPLRLASHDKLIRDFHGHHFLEFVHVAMAVIIHLIVSVYMDLLVGKLWIRIIADGEFECNEGDSFSGDKHVTQGRVAKIAGIIRRQFACHRHPGAELVNIADHSLTFVVLIHFLFLNIRVLAVVYSQVLQTIFMGSPCPSLTGRRQFLFVLRPEMPAASSRNFTPLNCKA